jgi:GntR family transcriptional regulator, rspAB operon transcriptional repressor
MVQRKRGLTIKQPQPIRKQVYEYLRELVLSQGIEPSGRLVEAQIAHEIGSSRTPVREALHLLEKDGFIESIPRVGYRVKTLNWEELDEIFEIRRVNETLACKWAIKNIDVKNLRALEKNLENSRALLKNGPYDNFIKHDEEFHEILVRSAGSRHLNELCQHIRRLMLRYRAASIKSEQTVNSALSGHIRIFSCLAAKDEQGLEKELADHLKWSKEDILASALKVTAGPPEK